MDKATAYNPVKDPKALEIKGKIIKTLKSCTKTTSFQNVYRWWVKTMANAIQNSCLLEGTARWNALEKEYLAIVENAGKEKIQRFCEAFGLYVSLLEAHPFADWLGGIYMELASAGEKGQFFTPYSVSQACARLVYRDTEADSEEPLTLNEPACGSGGMVIAWIELLASKGINWQRRARVTCGDIDECCVHMAYVTLSILGVRATVLHQDTLTLKTWSVWKTPAEMFGAAMFLSPTATDATDAPKCVPETVQNATESTETEKPSANTSETQNAPERKSGPIQRSLF